LAKLALEKMAPAATNCFNFIYFSFPGRVLC